MNRRRQQTLESEQRIRERPSLNCTPFSRFSIGFNNEKYSNHLFEIKIATPSVSESTITKLRVNTLLLASQSPYFNSLFTNGMKESLENKTTFTFSDEEEKEAFIDMIQYLYNGQFKSHSFNHLLKVLILSDQYAVAPVIEVSSLLFTNFLFPCFLALQQCTLHSAFLSFFVCVGCCCKVT
jgi:hypothetical protein